ncbi:MAG: hypothetical protein LQ342_007646 [Letrouitia transgressa]|nr:MAG: hypothetical protein LQ342_007646 [Letrouitia transgressa]
MEFASRDDIWRLQNEMKNVYATQAEHADRLMRLERRNEDDVRVKSVWGGQSPFPTTLSGTPQQEQGYNPAAEAFKTFDQDQSQNLLGSLHLDSEDEPRRGTSRANSVRFDESALHGHFGHNSRSSTDFLPLRTGSGLGTHPLVERSSSHKSDGRQSSAGQSIQSARASSFGFESRPLSATVPPFVPLGPPPGLFILGPVPSIIRCWLNTDYSSDSLLYAAVCTGSYKSTIDMRMIESLGLSGQISFNREGAQIIKIPVYLPEATIQQASSRSNSPVPQLPTLTVDFVVQSSTTETDAIRIFLGCDVLRARNADIHFSLDRLTLLDDERNKLSVPLVRPENAALFQNLSTTYLRLGGAQEPSLANSQSCDTEMPTSNGEADGDTPNTSTQATMQSGKDHLEDSTADISAPSTSTSSVIGQGRQSISDPATVGRNVSTKADVDLKDPDNLANGGSPDTPTRADSMNIWGSWRRDSQSGRQDPLSSNTNQSPGYHRGGRGRGMKVLKPARLNTTRSSSITQPPLSAENTLGRSSEAGKWGSVNTSSENQDPRTSATDRRFSGGAKSPLQNLGNKPTKSNPIGEASAFGWLNSGQHKQADTNTI